MRLFIALLPDKSARGRINEYAAAAGEKAVRIENLHMTLVFIGETERLSKIKEAMSSVRFKALKIRIDRYGCFGEKKKKLLWVGGEPSEALLRLYREIVKELSMRGVIIEERKFIPHITICRRYSGDMPEIVPDMDLNVERISLMQSVKENGSTVYKELYSVRADSSI